MNTSAVGLNATNTAVNSPPPAMAGAAGPGGLLSETHDIKEAQTDAKFGDVLKNIQAKYGAKAEKPREIKKTLGKDDFLKIMITQMRHQDPTNPFKAEQMATEMAQFTSVEQLQNMNQNMAKMTTQNQPLERLAMTGLIGKMVTVDRDRFTHAEGSNESLSFSLPRDAKNVKIAVVSDAGEVVMEKDLGAHKGGEGVFAWDGLKSNTLPAKTGNYMLKVVAVDEKEQSMHLDSQRTAKVVGISFEGPEAVVLVGDARHQDRVPVKSLIRVENDYTNSGGSGGAPGAAAGSANGPIQAGPSSSFFTFKPGVGSENIDPTQANPDIAAALAKYEKFAGGGGGSAPATGAPNPEGAASASAASSSAPAPAAPQAQANLAQAARSASLASDRGFPNGLSDSDERSGGVLPPGARPGPAVRAPQAAPGAPGGQAGGQRVQNAQRLMEGR